MGQNGMEEEEATSSRRGEGKHEGASGPGKCMEMYSQGRGRTGVAKPKDRERNVRAGGGDLDAIGVVTGALRIS